jgi:hypothetical protein
VWSVRDITSAYANAMQLRPRPWLLLHSIGVSAAVLAAGVWLVRRRLHAGRWAAEIGLAAIVYLLVKAGFVRADVHMYITAFGLLVLSILLAVLWSLVRNARVAALLVVVLPAPCGAWPRLRLPVLNFPPIFPRAAIARLAWLPVAFDRDALNGFHARQLAGIRTDNPLPDAVRGTVDIYPDKQSVALAYPLEFRPRPVFQSYMAYSPRLARANADFLLDAAAPEWILFRIAPIDQHLRDRRFAPWPLLLTRAIASSRSGWFAPLRRRAVRWRGARAARASTRERDLVNVPQADGPDGAHRHRA